LGDKVLQKKKTDWRAGNTGYQECKDRAPRLRGVREKRDGKVFPVPVPNSKGGERRINERKKKNGGSGWTPFDKRRMAAKTSSKTIRIGVKDTERPGSEEKKDATSEGQAGKVGRHLRKGTTKSSGTKANEKRKWEKTVQLSRR